MLISLTVGKVDAGVAVLLTQDKRLIEFPSILLPPNISSGSIVDITVARNINSESKYQDIFNNLQDRIYHSFGSTEPEAPILRCRNATQTSVVLEWDPIFITTADVISLSLFRNGQKAGNIPKPNVMQSTKISGLAVDTEYVFHLLLRTTAGTYASDKVSVRTHKMTDLSGITVTAGILPGQLRDSLMSAIERIGAKMADVVRIDTTHFVTTEGRGPAWEKATEMNIPVVRPEWVEGCERGGRVVGVRGYYLDADPRLRQVVSQTERVETRPKRVEGNGNVNGNGDGNSNGNGTAHVERPPTPPTKDSIPAEPRVQRPSNDLPEHQNTTDGEVITGSPSTFSEADDMSPVHDDQAESKLQKNIALRPKVPEAPLESSTSSPEGVKSPKTIGLGLDVHDTRSPREGERSAESTPGGSFQEVAL